jgi:hypothetical protein
MDQVVVSIVLASLFSSGNVAWAGDQKPEQEANGMPSSKGAAVDTTGPSGKGMRTQRFAETRPSKGIKWLGEVVSPAIGIQMSSVAGSYFRLTINVPNAPVDSKRRRCLLPAPRARASLNGIAMTRIRGVYRGGDLTYDRDCLLEFGFGPPVDVKLPAGREPVQMGGALPASALTPDRAVVRIEDDSARWTWEIPDAFSQRRLSFESPADGTISRGSKIVLRWSPASDQLGPQVTVEIERSATTRQELSAKNETGRIAFTVPSNLPPAFDGPATLRVHAAVSPGTGPCPVSSCQISLDTPPPSIRAVVNGGTAAVKGH